MQNLEVISVNLWNILISLFNLIILFIVIKKFLFKPVNNMLLKRQNELDEKYKAAEDAQRSADENKALWDEQIKTVKSKTDDMIKEAQSTAKKQGDSIVSKAKEQAEGIVKQAENQAIYEKKKAQEEIKQEIVEVSTALANKILEREINVKDHHELIDSFIRNIGEDDE